MATLNILAAVLCFAVGLAHSVLGERYILVRLFRRTDLPKLFGGTEFTVRTLRGDGGRIARHSAAGRNTTP